jgi:hypothetical protein
MNETTKFTSHMCHESLLFVLEKLAFSWSVRRLFSDVPRCDTQPFGCPLFVLLVRLVMWINSAEHSCHVNQQRGPNLEDMLVEPPHHLREQHSPYPAWHVSDATSSAATIHTMKWSSPCSLCWVRHRASSQGWARWHTRRNDLGPRHSMTLRSSGVIDLIIQEKRNLQQKHCDHYYACIRRLYHIIWSRIWHNLSPKTLM